MAADPTLPLGLNVNGHVGAGDAAMMFPQAAPMLSGLPAASPVKVGIDVDGTTGRLNLRRAAIEVNRCVEIKADGVVEYPMDPRRLFWQPCAVGTYMGCHPVEKQDAGPRGGKDVQYSSDGYKKAVLP